MIEDTGLKGFAAAAPAALAFRVQVFLAQRRAVVGLGQVSVGIEGIRPQRLPDLLGDLLQFPGSLRLLGQRAAIQLFGDGLGQVLRDELLDHVPLVVHDAVDAEVQVGAVELEEFAQEISKFVQRFVHHLPSSGFCRQLIFIFIFFLRAI